MKRRIDLPTRLLTWALRRWKRNDMADDKKEHQKKPVSAALTHQTQSLYFKLRAGENITLSPAEKEIVCAAMERQWPVLKRQARAVKGMGGRFGGGGESNNWNQLFWLIMAAGAALLLYAAYKGN